MPARGRLRRVAGHVVEAAAQPRLINVGPEEQSPATRSPWAGWGIGSYEDPDDGTDYSWRDELIEPGVHHQLFIDDGALDAFVKERYASYRRGIGKRIMNGQATFAELARYAHKNGESEIRSGREEMLENMINSYI